MLPAAVTRTNAHRRVDFPLTLPRHFVESLAGSGGSRHTLRSSLAAGSATYAFVDYRPSSVGSCGQCQCQGLWAAKIEMGTGI